MYQVLIESRAERDLKKVSPNIFRRLINHILALRENPRPLGTKKIAGSRNDWRLRIGDYRVIYEIDDPKRLIRVYRIRHRREVYREI